MTGADLKTKRKALGLTQDALAEILEVARITVIRWERNEVPIPKMLDLALQKLEQDQQSSTDS